MRLPGNDCAVARLMKDMGIQGVIRGKPHRTTIPDKSQPCPLDKVNRQFSVPAPDSLWVSDFTYVATWSGFVYVAPRHRHSDQCRSNGSMIDAFARRIVGWRVSRTAHAGFVLPSRQIAVQSPAGQWMPSNKPFISGSPERAWCTTAIAARNTCRSDTPSAWPLS